ncbi:MAG: hypothetical protein NTU63_03270 [Candidatus Pacearchaeota archaeon]|nr:hypothetical protein [Candidatus Pacearchaeota archaeon]
MAKREIKKTNEESGVSPETIKIEKVLVENFTSLQQVMTNLAIKFDNLSNQISQLLELFEISAKALAEREVDTGDNEPDKKIMEKLDGLLEQNKIIARGLSFIHEKTTPEMQSRRLGFVQKTPQQYPNKSSSKVIEVDRYERPLSDENQEPSSNQKFRKIKGEDARDTFDGI